jgi:excisionase family DNA binding protein
MTEPVDEFLTVAEVAELNQQTVRNWIDAGSLPAVRIGRRVRVRRHDLDRKLAEGYTGATDSWSPGPSADAFWAAAFWDGEALPQPDVSPDGDRL